MDLCPWEGGKDLPLFLGEILILFPVASSLAG